MNYHCKHSFLMLLHTCMYHKVNIHKVETLVTSLELLSLRTTSFVELFLQGIITFTDSLDLPHILISLITYNKTMGKLFVKEISIFDVLKKFAEIVKVMCAI